MPHVLDPTQSYTFSKFFELKPEVDELVQDFGYSLLRTRLPLPQYAAELERDRDRALSERAA